MTKARSSTVVNSSRRWLRLDHIAPAHVKKVKPGGENTEFQPENVDRFGRSGIGARIGRCRGAPLAVDGEANHLDCPAEMAI